MSELRIVLVRHGERDRDAPDALAGLTPYGKKGAQDLAAHLRRIGIFPQHCFTSSLAHARQTAEILVGPPQGDQGSITETEMLTPGSAENLFTIENLVEHAYRNEVQLNSGTTIALVGHEGRLSQLISMFTGQRYRPLDSLDAICLSAPSIQDFRCGTARLLWRLPVRAYMEEDLREKVASKTTVATLLAGFTFAGIVALVTGDPPPNLFDSAGRVSPLPLLEAALAWMGVISLTVATALFIAAVYIYDRLSMPEGFWIRSRSGTWGSLPRFVRENKDEYGFVYSYMIHAWTRVVTPGVAFAGVGFLFFVASASSWGLATLTGLVLIGVAWYYSKVRPTLGVD